MSAPKAPVVKLRKSMPGAFRTFERLYRPFYIGDSIMREADDADVAAANPNRVWSIVDTDLGLCLVPGFAVVNYIGRVLCAIPWGESEESNTGYWY